MNDPKLNTIGDFLSFRTMITPIIIRVLFWLGVVVSVIAGLIAIVAGASSDRGGGDQVFFGFATLLIGPITVRVYCEILILLFRISDTLTEIKNNQKGGPSL